MRVNPDIDAKSHPQISTGLKINKFGVPLDEARELLQTLKTRPALTLVAIHVHVGSQITSIDPLRRAAALAAGVSRELQQQGFPLEYVDVGGGLGVSYDGGEVPSAADYVGALVDAVKPTGLPIVVEPGRSIAAPAGALLARVVDLKPRTATSDFIIIDAGMTELMRPALYGAFHRIEPVEGPASGERHYEIVGPVCESSDVVGRDRMLPALQIGDVVAIRDAGAYGSVMASNYNRRPLPAEVLVDDGSWRVIRRRQTVDDQLSLGDVAVTGLFIAFEGLDQSGKQTQAERLRDYVKEQGRKARLVSFPDYGTSIGEEIARALSNERDYGPDVMQLLYVANRYEKKADLLRWLEGGLILVSDRYTASSVAYGEAFGLDAAWLTDMQKFLPPAVADHPARHRAGDGREAQVGRPRSLRARSGDAGPRPRELPASGGGAGLDRHRRRARQGRDRRRRHPRGAVTTRAAVSARTSAHPGLLQRPRARLERRAGRAHIIDQHDNRPSERRGVRASPRRRRACCDGAGRPAGRSASRWRGRGAARARRARRDAARDRPPD